MTEFVLGGCIASTRFSHPEDEKCTIDYATRP
jgi:hypothetical protein